MRFHFDSSGCMVPRVNEFLIWLIKGYIPYGVRINMTYSEITPWDSNVR